MKSETGASPLDNIVALAHEIIDKCPDCAGKASEIVVWVSEVRERRPDRAEITALVDATVGGALPEPERAVLIDSMLALVRLGR